MTQPIRPITSKQGPRPLHADDTATSRTAVVTNALVTAARTLYGLDGSDIDTAVDAAWTPSGPSRDAIRNGITALRSAPAATYAVDAAA